ncbi:MAG TPA: aromatic amino acid transaminase [Allosphingosinicella sp.]|nr:aromatic amino acid transaminase [Allosphingosinicella sp.]
MFDRFPEPAADALHAVMGRYRADPRPHRIDLGVGVYRDATGASPIMRAVKEAEAVLLREEESKAYQALHGDDRFIAAMTRLVFGDDHPAVRDGRLAAIQGTGGTGSLRIAFDAAALASPHGRLHLGEPSWPNHGALAAAAEIQVIPHPYLDAATQKLDWDAVAAAASGASPGDLFIIHGPCHNPTGADPSLEQRRDLLAILTERGAVPLIDAAYYGLAEGLDADLGILREAAARLERAFIAVSCSKVFGLYRERTGILFALCANTAERTRVQGQLDRIGRTLVSMPPAHGAGTVTVVLGDARLSAWWRDELAAMRARIAGLRSELAGHANEVPMLRGIDEQRGIFRMLPLSPEHTERLGRDHAIHLPPSGRINIAGLKRGDAARLAEALAAVAARA